MLKIFIVSVLTVFSSAVFASQYACTAKTNIKLFKVGQSQYLLINVVGGHLSLDNRSSVWNHLNQTRISSKSAFYKSIPGGDSESSAYETLDLTAFLSVDMLNNVGHGQLTLIKQNGLRQAYSCSQI